MTGFNLYLPIGGEWRAVYDPGGFRFTAVSGSRSLGGVINALLPYVFTISGLVLLVMIIASGYSLLTSAGNPEGMEKAKKRLSSALIGFIIIFAAFWIYQLVAVFIGLNQDFG